MNLGSCEAGGRVHLAHFLCYPGCTREAHSGAAPAEAETEEEEEERAAR